MLLSCDVHPEKWAEDKQTCTPMVIIIGKLRGFCE